jgi:hypothetical protein
MGITQSQQIIPFHNPQQYIICKKWGEGIRHFSQKYIEKIDSKYVCNLDGCKTRVLILFAKPGTKIDLNITPVSSKYSNSFVLKEHFLITSCYGFGEILYPKNVTLESNDLFECYVLNEYENIQIPQLLYKYDSERLYIQDSFDLNKPICDSEVYEKYPFDDVKVFNFINIAKQSLECKISRYYDIVHFACFKGTPGTVIKFVDRYNSLTLQTYTLKNNYLITNVFNYDNLITLLIPYTELYFESDTPFDCSIYVCRMGLAERKRSICTFDIYRMSNYKNTVYNHRSGVIGYPKEHEWIDCFQNNENNITTFSSSYKNEINFD